MKKTCALVLLMVMAGVTGVRAESQAGVGMQVGVPTGDLENGAGLYAFWATPLLPEFHFKGGLSYLQGDFAKDGLEDGEYTSIGVEASLMYQDLFGDITGYAGVGVGYYFNEIENDVTVDDKLGIFYDAGVYIPLADRLQLELGLRYLFLRPDGPDFAEIEMDTLLLKAGAVFTF